MARKVARLPTSRMKNSRRLKRQAPSAIEAARPTAIAAPGVVKPSRTQKTMSGARPRWTTRKVFTAFSTGGARKNWRGLCLRCKLRHNVIHVNFPAIDLPSRPSSPRAHRGCARAARRGRTRRGGPARGGAPRRRSPTATYRHFRDKDALLAAVAAEGFREFAAALADAGRRGEPLSAMGAAYVDFALARPGMFGLMFSPLMAKRELYPELRAAADEAFAQLRHGVQLASAGRREFRYRRPRRLVPRPRPFPSHPRRGVARGERAGLQGRDPDAAGESRGAGGARDSDVVRAPPFFLAAIGLEGDPKPSLTCA